MRACIIGLGAISPLHINAVCEAGGEICGICDIQYERCEKTKSKYKLSCNLYNDYRQMLDIEKPDVVHICTPHYLHAEMICECLDRNINVLCEKPMAISEGQLKKVCVSVENSKAQLGICQQNRFNLSVQYLKELFSGDEILSASGNLCWQRDASYYRSEKWRGTLLQEGGGVMINQALHTLDLLQWFCGMPVSVISHGANDTLKGVIDVEESQYSILKLANGGRCILTATNACTYSFPITIMLKSKKTEAVLVGDHMIINGKFVTKSDGLPLFGKEVWGTGHIKLIKNFYDCISTGKKFSIDFYESKKVVELILALYRSQGQEIFLN